MTFAELENLARLGHLKREPPVASDVEAARAVLDALRAAALPPGA